MPLLVASLSVELVAALRPLVVRIKRHDRSLADQLVRAASSVALNIAVRDFGVSRLGLAKMVERVCETLPTDLGARSRPRSDTAARGRPSV